jgi:hypothetical protein
MVEGGEKRPRTREGSSRGDVRDDSTAASAAYLNQALEPTPYSFRYASASGGGSPRALGVCLAMAALRISTRSREHENAD